MFVERRRASATYLGIIPAPPDADFFCWRESELWVQKTTQAGVEDFTKEYLPDVAAWSAVQLAHRKKLMENEREFVDACHRNKRVKNDLPIKEPPPHKL